MRVIEASIAGCGGDTTGEAAAEGGGVAGPLGPQRQGQDAV